MTGLSAGRVMGEDRLFYAAARLALSEEELNRVFAKMRDMGATFD